MSPIWTGTTCCHRLQRNCPLTFSKRRRVGRSFSGHDKRAPPPPEGPARQVRGTTFDNPSQFCGHDKRAPPNLLSEGPARRVRCVMLDYPFHFHGHDKCAPPGGRDMHTPPNGHNSRAHPTLRRGMLVASALRRDLLVRSAVSSWIIHFYSAGTTTVPLRLSLSPHLRI